MYNQRDLDNFSAPKVLILKENAQVMLIKNLTPTLVNGSVGKVVGFQELDHVQYPVVRFTNGEQRVMKREEWSKESKGKEYKLTMYSDIGLIHVLLV